jgi:hypothetical protein
MPRIGACETPSRIAQGHRFEVEFAAIRGSPGSNRVILIEQECAGRGRLGVG